VGVDSGYLNKHLLGVGLLCAQNSLKERFVHVQLHTMSCTMCSG